MLWAGAAAGAGRDVKSLSGVEQLLPQPLAQVLEVMRGRGLVVQLVPDVAVALRGLCLRLAPLDPGGVVVVVVVMAMTLDVAVRLWGVFVFFGAMLVLVMWAVAVAVPVRVTVRMVEGVAEAVVVVVALFAHGFLGVQWGSLALRGGAVLPHLVDEEELGHVVYDEHSGPVRDGLGLSAAEMNVHDEDGERGGGCDHSHGGYVILP